MLAYTISSATATSQGHILVYIITHDQTVPHTCLYDTTRPNSVTYFPMQSSHQTSPHICPYNVSPHTMSYTYPQEHTTKGVHIRCLPRTILFTFLRNIPYQNVHQERVQIVLVVVKCWIKGPKGSMVLWKCVNQHKILPIFIAKHYIQGLYKIYSNIFQWGC